VTSAEPAAPAGARVVLGVAGGIAAYKACELVRLFTESGHSVRVVPTAAAVRFVGETSGRRPTRCRTYASAARPSSWWSRPRPRT
jgi:phosphopantothenoylcysteine synthetase/decarboxylase